MENHQSTLCLESIPLRVATRADLTLHDSKTGSTRPLVGKDFWVKNNAGQLEYYRVPGQEGSVSETIKTFLPLGRVYVVDTDAAFKRRMEESKVKAS